MKVSFSKHFFRGQAKGLQKFGDLLQHELRANHKVQIVPTHARSDIHLTAISGPPKSKARNVLRIDGVYYDKKRLPMNQPIKRSIKTFDGVIYQSQWAQVFAEKMLKVKAKKSEVIYNGTKLFPSQSKSSSEKVFICCAIWRSNKRLETITKAFLAAKSETELNLRLLVIGDPDFVLKDSAIKYFGKVNSDLFDLYKQADYMCHICHLDACPNSVIEALAMGIPVLCNNIGGTPEVVCDSGIILDLDKPFDFKAVKSMKDVGPRSIDQKVVKEGMLQMVEKSWLVKRPDLAISVSAQKYYDFFSSLL